MPTEPLESIIYRDLAKANASGFLEITSPLLIELVNFGSNALVRCATSSEGEKNVDLAILSLYRHILEMTDGIQELLAEACAMPGVPLVRSSFEALISMEYIVEHDANYVSRSLAWLVQYANEKIKTYELFDPSTRRGAEFQTSVQNDKSVPSLPMPPTPDVQSAISNLQSLLSEPQFSQLNSDFQSLSGNKVWYRLYGGPNNLRELAHHVGRSALYDLMYRYWSRVAHAHDFSPFIDKTNSGHPVIRSIRSTDELKNVASFASTIFIASTRTLIGKFRPTEDISGWYEREVRPLFMQVIST